MEFDTDFGGAFRSTGLLDEPALPEVANGLADAADDLRNGLDAAQDEIRNRMTIGEAIAFLEENAPGRAFGLTCTACGYAGPLPTSMKGNQSYYEVRWFVGGHCHTFSGASWREVIDAAISAVSATGEPKAA